VPLCHRAPEPALPSRHDASDQLRRVSIESLVEQHALAGLREALEGSYRLEREIGRGGMASIYLAQDIRHDRPVAIKVLRPSLAGLADLPERFLREVRFAARLVHPHILPIHDSGRHGRLLYYVMPYLSGESLRERLDRDGQFPVEEALRITRAVASGLDYAHRQGIVHRDIKPDNILLSEGHPVLADFGVARAIYDAGAESLTTLGAAVGTPAYMSPEQAAGDTIVDGRSDLYSLACVLYEMLGGKPPFPGLPVQATLYRHLTQAPDPITLLRPTVPTPVQRALDRALAKQPGERYESVAQFAEALGGSVTAPGPSSVVGGGRDARAIAVIPFRNQSAASELDYLSDGVTDEVAALLSQVEGLHVVSRRSVEAQLEHGTHDLRALGAALNAAYTLEGSLRESGGRLRVTAQLSDTVDGRLLWSGRYDRQIADVFALEEDLARTIVATLRAILGGELSDPIPRRYTENPRAYHLYLQGRHAWNQRTPESIQDAIALFEQALAEDPDYALAHTGLADCYAIQLDYRGTPVHEGMMRAKAEARRALELDEGLAEAHTSLGWVTFIYDWDWSAAGREFQRAIELNPRYATARQWHAWFLIAMGRVAEAVAEGRIAASLEPASVSIVRSLGWIQHVAGQHDEAAATVARALAMDPRQEETHRVMGLAHLGAERWREAEASFARGLELAPDSAYALAGLGATHALAGRPDRARDVIEQLEGRAQAGYVSPTAYMMIYAALGDADQTFRWAEACFRERRGWLVYLRVQPLLAGIRSDPRYSDWLARMKLV